MRKLTKTEAFFLAATLTSASLTTLEVTPKYLKAIERQSAIVQAEIKRKKITDPRDAFSTGLVVGAAVGALVTVKVIAAKLNGCP